MANKLISIIVPVYNESANIEWFYGVLADQFKKTPKYDFEVILIDDGSKDDSAKIIKKLADKNSGVRFIQFSRNFGKESATTAGLNSAKGDAAIMIDSDGQHPPKLIGTFLDEWAKGNEVVIGVRKANTGEGFVKRYGSKLFYALLGSATGGETKPGATDYRLVDRKVIDEFNKLTERNRITRGLIDWLGFKRCYVDFEAPARHGGKASYSYRKLVKLAVHGLVSQTTKPLQIAGVLGFFVIFASTVLGIFLLIEKYALGDPMDLNITGTSLLALFLSFLVGLVLICQWLLALYVESIHSEAQNRPLYIVTDESK